MLSANVTDEEAFATSETWRWVAAKHNAKVPAQRNNKVVFIKIRGLNYFDCNTIASIVEVPTRVPRRNDHRL